MLKNFYSLVDELTDILIDFEAHPRACETDVYLYVDEDDNGDAYGRLEEFENPGGQSWIPDEHVRVYSDRPEHDAFAFCDDEESVACALDMSLDDLMKRTRAFLVERDGDEVEGCVDYCDVQDYVRSAPGMYTKLCEGVAHFSSVEDACRDYAYAALHEVEKGVD